METYTQSEITMWDECPKKHDFQYRQLLGLKNPSPAWSLLYGTAVHEALDQWRQKDKWNLDSKIWLAALQIKLPDHCLLTTEEEVKLDYYNQLLRVQVERYMIYYAEDFEIMKLLHSEQILRTEFMGVQLEGKIDAVYQIGKKIVMMDTKTSGRYSSATYESWQFKFQFMFYMWLLQRCNSKMKVNEMWIDCIVKPALKQGKNESRQDLINRVRQDMIQEPKKYFIRVPMHNMKGIMDKFEKEVLIPKINRIRLVEELLTTGVSDDILNILTQNMNTNNCVKFNQTCQFLPLCVHGQAEAFRYVKRADKHVELVGEVEE